jgi:hypothetical protein
VNNTTLANAAIALLNSGNVNEARELLNVMSERTRTGVESPFGDNAGFAPKREAGRDVPPPPASQPRQRRNVASSVGYVLATGRNKRDAAVIDAAVAELPNGNVRTAYDTIRKLAGRAGKPVTAREIETATGMKYKAVQSAVWALRACIDATPGKTVGVIRSVPLGE